MRIKFRVLWSHNLYQKTLNSKHKSHARCRTGAIDFVLMANIFSNMPNINFFPHSIEQRFQSGVHAPLGCKRGEQVPGVSDVSVWITNIQQDATTWASETVFFISITVDDLQLYSSKLTLKIKKKYVQE